MEHPTEEQHQPIRVYLVVWGSLFVLSVLSYLVDFFGVQPLWFKWALLIALALIKASLIVSFFMHLRFERLSLVYAILLPPILLLALAGIVLSEGDYVIGVRHFFFGG